MRFPKLFLIVAITVILFILSQCPYFGYSMISNLFYSENLFKNSPFELGEKFTYKVDYNGVYMGRIEGVYLGKQNIDNKIAYTISLLSDVKILKVFSLQSKEKLYIDSDTHLPLRVEREVRYLGRYEEILEEYNQKDGFVKIIKKDGKRKEEKRLEVKALYPGYRRGIHNVIALLYFPPKDIKLNLGESFSFNLPTQKISIKVVAFEILDVHKVRYETFRLEGQPRKFKVWLEKERRLPLLIEFPVFLGRVTILKNEE